MRKSKRRRLGLEPEPGPLPTRRPPRRGQGITIEVAGIPPIKDVSFSIRNPRHRHYGSFIKLRRAAIRAMAGRRWYDGAIGLSLVYRDRELRRGLVDFLGGVMDTLDGSHGMTFTYLPVIYQDDCQVCESRVRFEESLRPSYTLEITFL
jgi:hypothetical protein